MKEDDAKTLIATRLEQAREILGDAQFLREAGRSGRSVVNRAYYAAFYALLALLQTIGKIPKKYQEAISLFDREFMRTALIKNEHSKSLHWLFDRRMDADYRGVKAVGDEEAETALKNSVTFIDTISRYLKDRGHLD